MIDDGSFDNGFLPAYDKALKNDEPVFTYAGSEYAVSYAEIIIDFVDNFRDNVNELKQFER